MLALFSWTNTGYSAWLQNRVNMRAITWSSMVLLSAVLVSGSNLYSRKDSKGFLPKSLERDVYFGMTYARFTKKWTGEIAYQDDGFRWTVDGGGDDEVETYSFYFTGNDDKNLLYEVIIDYKDAEIRDKIAEKVLGKPNHGTEWYFARNDKFDIKAWLYKNKLVIVGIMPGCEWDE